MTTHVPNAIGLAGTLLAAACVPRVPAALVMTEPDEPEPDAPEPDEPKPEAKKPRPSGPDHMPPAIIRVEQLGETLLRLHFSEPIAEPSGFDPNDFRLSVLNVYIDPARNYAYASYYDLGYMTYGHALRFVSARAHDDQLDLQFSTSVGLHYCRQFNYDHGYDHGHDYAAPGVRADSGLFLHYAAGSIPIRDEAGNALASFGEPWVRQGRSQPPQSRTELHGAAAQAVGKDLIEVECGPRLPEGPR